MAEADAVTITAIVGAATGLVSLIVMAMKIRQDEAEILTLQDLSKSLMSVVATYDREVASLRRDVEAFRTLIGTNGEVVLAKVDREEERRAGEHAVQLESSDDSGEHAGHEAQHRSDKHVRVGKLVGSERGEEEGVPHRLEYVARGDDEAKQAEHRGRGTELPWTDADDLREAHEPTGSLTKFARLGYLAEGPDSKSTQSGNGPSRWFALGSQAGLTSTRP